MLRIGEAEHVRGQVWHYVTVARRNWISRYTIRARANYDFQGSTGPKIQVEAEGGALCQPVAMLLRFPIAPYVTRAPFVATFS